MSTSRGLTVSEPELFGICRQLYSEPIARVTSVALYWTQFALHRLRGQLGIYKTDDDLGNAIGRHPKTAGTNLMKVCSPRGQNPGAALFEVTYGPKAGQDGGRCRWLFITPRGEQIIETARKQRGARELVKRNRASTGEKGCRSEETPDENIKRRQSTDTISTDQSPRMTPTLFTEDSSAIPSNNISSRNQRERLKNYSEKGVPEGKESRISRLWEQACKSSGRSDRLWRPSEVRKFHGAFSEIESMAFVKEMSDQTLSERLKLLCNDLKRVEADMSEAFSLFNKDGLRAQSFAIYGDKLLQLAGQKSSKGIDVEAMLKMSDLD